MVTIQALFGTIIMLYVMFYFFSMGTVLLDKILYYLPLRDDDERRLLKQFTSVTRATLKGTLIIGIMQGTICGLGFYFADIEGPVFWGTVMAVTSVIPAFGTAIIWVPAAILLALTGNWAGAIILAVICGLISGNLDNLVRPRLVGKDKRHLRFAVRQRTANGGSQRLNVIGFGLHRHLPALKQSQRRDQPFEMLFTINENTWNGRTELQLQARDLRMTNDK